MLKVVCVKNIGAESTVVCNNSVVVVEDQFGNPIVVIAHIQDRTNTVVTADDPDFNKILSGLGIDKLVVNDKLLVDMPLPSGNVKLLRGPTGALIQ